MKNDRRFIKTENQIIAVFSILLNEKGFNHLTVKDIADRANINRATFYQHYTDKYQLIEACTDHFLHEANQLVQLMMAVDIRALSASDQLFPGLIELLSYYKDNRSLLLGLLESGENSSLYGRLMNGAQEHLQQILQDQFGGNVAYPMRYITAYLLSAHFNVMIEWLRGGTVESVEEIAELITHLTLHGAIRGLNLD
ncbi:MAG: TetR/AcrR family transcriptional regulator [Sporolactobacillus sp.]